MALGPATVVDLFFYHQRGRAMGIFTVILTSGAHIAPIVGGLIGQYLGWRWTFKFAAILDGVMLLVITFCLPATLYIRDQSRLTRTMSEREIDFTPKTYVSQLRLYSTFPQLKLRWNQFIIPSLKMAKYPSVLFPALYYAASYGFASILPAVTVASIFSEVFHWDTLEIGLAYGGALSIGGESPLLCRFLTILIYFRYTGRICSRHSARRHHQARSPSVCRSKPTARIPPESNLDWSYPRPCWIINIRLYTGIPRLLVCPSFWHGARLLWLASRRHHLLHLYHRLVPSRVFRDIPAFQLDQTGVRHDLCILCREAVQEYWIPMGFFPLHDLQRAGFHPGSDVDAQGDGMEGEVGNAEKCQRARC